MASRCKYTTKEVDLLARLMKAEAVGEGKKGMLLVGNVGVNRVVAKCDLFKKIHTITQMVYQDPGGFTSKDSKLFNSGANKMQKNLALKTIKSWQGWPATRSLFFYSPGKGNKCKKKFFGDFVGQFKGHCFYQFGSDMKCGL